MLQETIGKVADHFQRFRSLPFLFIGSGFSLRHLGLDNWQNLLRHFCQDIRPFEYYSSSCGQDLPCVASLMSTDFHEAFWRDAKFAPLLDKYKASLINKHSALKVAISDYLSQKATAAIQSPFHTDEIETLKEVTVDGVITTNWDQFVEKIFPDNTVYIGQDELLFSNPQSISETYKIHGCVSNPNSLILTREDYEHYENKNAYLAAKLITLFVEHPVVFIGYSLADPNIARLLGNIVACIGPDRTYKLQENLFFLQRTRGDDTPLYSRSYLGIGEIQLPITIVKLPTFTPFYSVLAKSKRKIPTRILRAIKEQLYQLIINNDPEDNIQAIDFDRPEEMSKVDFVVGVGIKPHLGRLGYRSIKYYEIYRDLLFDDQNFDAKFILEETAPGLLKGNAKFVPIFQYLRRIGICSVDDYSHSGLALDKVIRMTHEDYQIKQWAKAFATHCNGMTMNELISNNDPRHAATYIPFLPLNDIDLGLLLEFIEANFDSHSDQSKGTVDIIFKRLICFYDRLKYGFFINPSRVDVCQ